jgi:hypothetical protein
VILTRGYGVDSLTMARAKARLAQFVSLFSRRRVPRLLELFFGPSWLRPTAVAGALLSALALLSPGLVISQSPTPLEREVNGQTLVSRSLPSVDLSFSSEFRYVGGQRFVLYQVADAEQHFFVDADENKRVRRFFWVQFEHFLPSNGGHYDYKPLRQTKIGDLTFIYDSKLYADYAGLKPSPDSDGARGRELLAKAGFTLPQSAARVRLIHLPVTDMRSELMIIYLESTTRERLPDGAKAEMPADDEFPQWSEFLLTHLRESLKIERRERQVK